jgi:phospholipid transport system substrate-binding protein
MTKNRALPGLLATLLLLTASAPSAMAQDEAAATTPTAFVQTKVDEVLQIVNRPVERGTDAFRQRQTDLKAAVRGFLDYRELVQRALGEHWNARTPEEQDHFVELMTRLIETNYTVKLGDEPVGSSYDITYQDETIRGNNARVTGTVRTGGETVAVELMLVRRGDAWIVWDVVTDDVSIQETYAESFEEIILDDGWPELVRRIEERLAELEAELAAQNG